MHDLVTDLIERKNLVGQARPRDKPRHSPNHAGGFILHEDAGAQAAERLALFHAVLAHAGKDHGKRARAIYGGDRAEEHVDGWAAEVFLWSLVRTQHRDAIFLVHHHMEVSGSDHDAAWGERFAGNAFLHR